MNDRTVRACVLSFVVARAGTAFAAEDPHTRSAAVPPPRPGAGEQLGPRDDGGGDDRASRAGDEETKPEKLRIGVLAGVGFPRPLAIEGLVKVQRVIAAGVEYSAAPALTIRGVNTSFWALSGDVRVFPFRNAFFLGLRAGYQHLGVASTVTVRNVGSAAIAARVNTTFLNPRLGFLWTWEPGVTLGLDAGLQFPLGSDVETDMPTLATGTILDEELIDVAHAIGQTMLPTVDLFRIGILL